MPWARGKTTQGHRYPAMILFSAGRMGDQVMHQIGAARLRRYSPSRPGFKMSSVHPPPSSGLGRVSVGR